MSSENGGCLRGNISRLWRSSDLLQTHISVSDACRRDEPPPRSDTCEWRGEGRTVHWRNASIGGKRKLQNGCVSTAVRYSGILQDSYKLLNWQTESLPLSLHDHRSTFFILLTSRVILTPTLEPFKSYKSILISLVLLNEGKWTLT